MRTLPFASVVIANCVRSVVEQNGGTPGTGHGLTTVVWINCGTSGLKIGRHVTPAASDRQMPRPKSPAYTVFELRGSNSKSFEPREEQPFAPPLFGGLQLDAVGPPSKRNVQVAPPSVVFHTPHACAPGLRDAAPPLTELMPRT